MERIIEVISWIGAIQGMLLVLLLFTSKNNKNANRLLAAFIGIITFDCMEPVFFKDGNGGLIFETWAFLWGGLVFLHGPLLFLYVKKMTKGQQPFVKEDLKHYTLPLVYFIIIISAYLFAWPEKTLEIGTVILHELFFLHLLIYSAVSLLYLRNYQLARTRDSAPERMNLKWLKSLLFATLCLYLFSFITTQISLIAPEMEMAPWHMTIQFILVFTMYTISYKSISQPQIFFQFHNGDFKAGRIVTEKYRTSSLDEENALQIKKKLILFMEDKKPYLDPNFSLEMLAKQLNESRYHISQVINEKLNSKFNDFVNQYRIAEFKQLVATPRRRKATVENLARLSGFNSKTSFHTVFKKVTGKTPSKFYKDANQISAQQPE